MNSRGVLGERDAGRKFRKFWKLYSKVWRCDEMGSKRNLPLFTNGIGFWICSIFDFRIGAHPAGSWRWEWIAMIHCDDSLRWTVWYTAFLRMNLAAYTSFTIGLQLKFVNKYFRFFRYYTNEARRLVYGWRMENWWCLRNYKSQRAMMLVAKLRPGSCPEVGAGIQW